MASEAVNASLTFQAANQACNDNFADDIQPVLRIGIAMGEVVIADNEIAALKAAYKGTLADV